MELVFKEAPKPISYDGMINELGQVIHGGVVKNEVSSIQDEQSETKHNGGSEQSDTGV